MLLIEVLVLNFFQLWGIICSIYCEFLISWRTYILLKLVGHTLSIYVSVRSESFNFLCSSVMLSVFLCSSCVFFFFLIVHICFGLAFPSISSAIYSCILGTVQYCSSSVWTTYILSRSHFNLLCAYDFILLHAVAVVSRSKHIML